MPARIVVMRCEHKHSLNVPRIGPFDEVVDRRSARVGYVDLLRQPVSPRKTQHSSKNYRQLALLCETNGMGLRPGPEHLVGLP